MRREGEDTNQRPSLAKNVSQERSLAADWRIKHGSDPISHSELHCSQYNFARIHNAVVGYRDAIKSLISVATRSTSGSVSEG